MATGCRRPGGIDPLQRDQEGSHVDGKPGQVVDTPARRIPGDPAVQRPGPGETAAGFSPEDGLGYIDGQMGREDGQPAVLLGNGGDVTVRRGHASHVLLAHTEGAVVPAVNSHGRHPLVREPRHLRPDQA